MSDDSRRQSVAQDVDHGPKPVAAETERPGDTVRPELLLEVLVSLLSQLGCFSAADHVCYVSYEITMLRYFLGSYATRHLLLCRFKLQIQNTFCLITTVTYRIQSMATMSVMSSGGRPTDVSTITMVTRPAWGIPAAPMLAAVAVMLQDRTTRMRTTEEEAGSLLGRRVMPSELRNSSEPERPALSPVKDPWGDILSGDSTLKPKQTLKKKFWYWRCQIYKFSSHNFLFDSVIVSITIF